MMQDGTLDAVASAVHYHFARLLGIRERPFFFPEKNRFLDSQKLRFESVRHQLQIVFGLTGLGLRIPLAGRQF
jgi:hypothetical protein